MSMATTNTPVVTYPTVLSSRIIASQRGERQPLAWVQ